MGSVDNSFEGQEMVVIEKEWARETEVNLKMILLEFE